MLRLCLRLAVVAAALAFAPAARAETALYDLTEPAPAAADGDTARVVLGTRIDVYRAFADDGIAFYAPEGSRLGGSWVYLWDGARLVASGRGPASPPRPGPPPATRPAGSACRSPTASTSSSPVTSTLPPTWPSTVATRR